MARLCPRGTHIQSVILPKDRFRSAAAARHWIQAEGFHDRKIHETDVSYRFRQVPPGRFTRGSFRTISLRPGVRAIIGCPRGTTAAEEYVMANPRRRPAPRSRPRPRPRNAPHRTPVRRLQAARMPPPTAMAVRPGSATAARPAAATASASAGGMSTGAKVAIGAVAIAALLGIFLYARNASAASSTSASSGTGTLDPNSAQGQAAIALASAIQSAGGYQGSQASQVVAYETAVNAATGGLTVDAGYPGQNVMAALRNDLARLGTDASSGQTYAAEYPLVGTIATYPWTTAGQWTAGNVPAAFADGTGAAWSGQTTVGT